MAKKKLKEMLIHLSYEGNSNKTTLRYHLTPIKIVQKHNSME
jgi:cAMP phosphodiesterase